MKTNARASNTGQGRRAFTLVELLVTITILGILAGMVSGAVVVARQSARIAATKATIAKLDKIVMARYESYRTRRVPLGEEDVRQIAAARYGIPFGNPVPLRVAALIRLHALRDLMRMEMPERWTDITSLPQYLLRWDATSNQLVRNPPSLYLAYRSRCLMPNGTLIPSGTNAPAECLYLLVTIAGGEEARRQFRSNEIGDTDGDGFPEFLDGWGRPIFFLRWAPGFNDSDLQLNLIKMEELEAGLKWTDQPILDRRQEKSQEDHDPFDPRKVDMAQNPSADDPPRGWRLFPLIYSAGPDGEYGISIDDTAAPYIWTEVPLTNGHYARGWGLPLKVNGAWVHFDNIHNHHIELETE